MRVVICEDNMYEAEALSEIIQEVLEKTENICNSIEIFSNAGEMLESESIYDIAFIDCRLPDISGTELAKKLRERGCNADFVFTSAYNEYAVDGYESDALRYLMKPVSKEKIAEVFCAFNKKNSFNSYINIKENGKPFLVRPSDIYYIEKSSNGVVVRLSDKTVQSDLSLSAFEHMIRYPTLVRSSRQFIVNLQHVKSIDGKFIKMKTDENAIISRRCLAKINNLYTQYLTSNYFTDE